MRCDDVKELLPLYLAGLLEVQEEGTLREHLDGGCPRCAAELAGTRQVVDLLPFGLPAAEPSPMVKARLVKNVRRSMTAAGAPALPFWMRAATAAGVAAVLAAALTTGVLARRHATAVAALRSEIDRQGAELAGMREQVRQARESIRLISAPGVLVVDLAGQGPRAGSTARVFWDRSGDRWQLYAVNLPPSEPGKIYQLWLITATARISAGTFQATPAGEAAGTIAVPPDAGPVLAAAITDEPRGGSPQPTGSILLLGKV
jgi:anti-sigma-K factor RskA